MKPPLPLSLFQQCLIALVVGLWGTLALAEAAVAVFERIAQ